MNVREKIAGLVADAAVYDLSDAMGCDLSTARLTLMAEAYAAVMGLPVDYSVDLEAALNV
jgi:hypothetical protein